MSDPFRPSRTASHSRSSAGAEAPSRSPAELAFARHVAAVEAKDRAAFLANFADDAVVEDPVGPSPLEPTGRGHRGRVRGCTPRGSQQTAPRCEFGRRRPA